MAGVSVSHFSGSSQAVVATARPSELGDRPYALRTAAHAPVLMNLLQPSFERFESLDIGFRAHNLKAPLSSLIPDKILLTDASFRDGPGYNLWITSMFWS